MTTNQTINGVPHDLLEAALKAAQSQGEPVVVVQFGGLKVIEDSSVPPGQIRMCNCNQGRLPCRCKP